MEYAIAAAIIALIAWLLFRSKKPQSRSKHGFTIGLEESRHEQFCAEQETAKQKIREFIAENDAAIRDVLSDYQSAHKSLGHVYLLETSSTARWCLRRSEAYSRGDAAICVVEVQWGRYYDGGSDTLVGKPLYRTLQVKVRRDQPDANQLAKVLETILRQSKCHPKGHTGVDYPESLYSPGD